VALSKRLKRFSEYYHNDHSNIWDIGCDHGLLGLSFLNKPSVKQINLVDPSLPVVNNLKDSYITIPRINIIHSKGQDLTIPTPNQNSLFIAGMGGLEIKGILQKLRPQLGKEDRVFISPHRHVLEIREFLKDTDYRLVEEGVLEEDGHYYPYLYLSLNSQFQEISLYGKEMWSGVEGQKYRSYLIGHLSCHKNLASQGYLNHLKSLISPRID
jgi:tRNA (adenine22-N1)-methyltransferase